MNDHPRFGHHDRSTRSNFVRAKKLSARYSARLRQIARHIGDIAKGFDATTLRGQGLIQSALMKYREVLQPWAEATAERFVAEIADADRNGWRRMSASIGRGVEREILSAPVAPVMARMKAEQVRLITSLPTDAAERVNKLVTQGLSTGRRADEIAKDIYETGEVTKSRATLIAVTETSRAATTLTQARAEHVGSTSYVWRTAGDADVRHDHKVLSGQVFRWDAPPIADQRTGARAHPGCIYRCRCWAEVILPD